MTAPKGPFSLLLLILTAHKFDWPLAVPLQETSGGMAISSFYDIQLVSITFEFQWRDMHNPYQPKWLSHACPWCVSLSVRMCVLHASE